MAIPNDEVVYIRIPPGDLWFRPPDKVSSGNFKLNHRVNEKGLSAYRKNVVNGDDVLRKPDAIAGSFVLYAKVGHIRELTDASKDKKPLGLDVVDVEIEGDLGHAEIRTKVGFEWRNNACSKAIQKLFCESLNDRIGPVN